MGRCKEQTYSGLNISTNTVEQVYMNEQLLQYRHNVYVADFIFTQTMYFFLTSLFLLIIASDHLLYFEYSCTISISGLLMNRKTYLIIHW